MAHHKQVLLIVAAALVTPNLVLTYLGTGVTLLPLIADLLSVLILFAFVQPAFVILAHQPIG